jgi:hypothetical protein
LNSVNFFLWECIKENVYPARLWWHDHSRILVAVVVIRGNLDNWFMSEIPFVLPVKHASKLKEVTLSILCEVHRTVSTSLRYMITHLC